MNIRNVKIKAIAITPITENSREKCKAQRELIAKTSHSKLRVD